MFGRCKHKFGKVQDDNYQYCEMCGTAKSVKCSHKWNTISHGDIIDKRFQDSSGKPRIIGETYIIRCAKCGDIIDKKFNCRLDVV